jgi:hypothetical protein
MTYPYLEQPKEGKGEKGEEGEKPKEFKKMAIVEMEGREHEMEQLD